MHKANIARSRPSKGTAREIQIRNLWKNGLVISFAASLLIGMVQFHSSTLQGYELLKRAALGIAESMLEPSQLAVEFLDNEFANRLVDGIIESGLFSSAIIIDDFGNDFAEKKISTRENHFLFRYGENLLGTPRQFAVEKTLVLEHGRLAKLILTADLGALVPKMYGDAIRDALLAALVMFLFCGLFFYSMCSG